MKIAIYGTGHAAEEFTNRLQNYGEDIEIVCFVESKKTKEFFKGHKVIEADELSFDKFDYLIIAVFRSKEIEEYLKKIRNDYQKIRFKILLREQFLFLISEVGKTIPFLSVQLSCGLKYIYASSDRAIGAEMLNSDENFAQKQINDFFVLTEKYYGKRDSGYFFDVGANIGTTSIYVKKRINPNLKIIGFEAGKINYDLFRTNLIINGCDDIKAEYMALGDDEGRVAFHYYDLNPGGSWVEKDKVKGKACCEDVHMNTLDNYCLINSIVPKDISFIWIDVEGFEACVLKGARGVLTEKIPLMQEFNPRIYIDKKLFDEYCAIVEKSYGQFIDCKEYVSGTEKVRSVSELREYAKKIVNSDNGQTDLFFIAK